MGGIVTDFKTVQETRDDVAEPFYGACSTHYPGYTFVYGSAHSWVGLDDGTFISQPEFFRREGVCCWDGLAEKRRQAEPS